MKLDLSDEALEFGRAAEGAIEGAGGTALFEHAASDPAGSRRVADVLGDIGAWDLAPRTDPDELEAAAALCRSAGRWAVPHPVAERLARPQDLEADALAVVGESRPCAPAAKLDLAWVAVTLDGRRSSAVPRERDGKPWSTTGVADLDLEALDSDGLGDVALGLTLPCWTLLGMLDRAIELTCAYVVDREQFGQSLSSFQGVQFQLTDAEVERAGVEVAATYALWSIQTGRSDALADALALRLAAVEAAEVVFRVTQQLHGAIGFCDETTLSWMVRAAQPLRRLPFGAATTRDLLARRLGRDALTGLYGEHTDPSSEHPAP